MRKQPRLADTLAQLAHAGLDDFYRGDIAREIAADLEALGSPVTRADLQAYEARWREPLSIKTKTATLYNTPVPTQGLASLLILGIYERLGALDVDSVDHAHALIEATKRAFAHRDRACVDFEIATEDFERLLSPASLQAEADRGSTCAAPRPGRCRPNRATRSGWAPSTRTASRSPTSSRSIGNTAPASCCRAPAS